MGSLAASGVNYPFDNIIDALKHTAAHTTEGIVSYSPAGAGEAPVARTVSYRELLDTAETNAGKLQKLSAIKPGSVVLVHFDDALETIVWYWSVLLAGGIPAVTSPAMFSQNEADRQKHLSHLYKTFDGPLCLTRQALLEPFEEHASEKRIDTLAIEDFDREPAASSGRRVFKPSPADVVALMLTSGSSGNAKAVPLSHEQLFAAFRGKTQAAKLPFPGSPFMSWVNMDHVANLVHCHLFAIVSGISQIQVPAANVLVDPAQLLNLISRHRVSRTFAPNFLLAKLRRQLEAGKTDTLDADLNLETLFLDTGGEANVIEVCAALQPLLARYGAPADVFKPSFGMTETCAGCIFNTECPSRDQAEKSEFASLGQCMPGVQMRVSRLDGAGDAAPGERGSLELKGDILFKGYYNNETATAEAFTADGWFRTGDLAYLDGSRCLHLDGRTKEMININGVKYLPHELDASLEQAEIPGATPSYFCCFGTRDASMDTEAVAVLYLPSYDESDDAARFETQRNIARVVSLHTRSRPRVVPLRARDMPKSTLGKLSRTKLKAGLESGAFASQQAANDAAIKRYRLATRSEPENDDEAAILDIVRQQLELSAEDDFGVNDSVLATGATSMDLVAIMHRMNKLPNLAGHPIKLTDLLNNPTIRGLSVRIAKMTGALVDTDKKPHEYDPVVTLQPNGSKTPLWLVHPGVGEVLVFVNLAHRIRDRPVYAFRAKGFNAAEGETPFKTLDEVFQTYRASIKKRQPKGPYAIAGYSFGGMVAFEVGKLLEAEGDEVAYCGSWNLPPHIKFRMRELLWDECVIHLFYFVGLMDEATAYTHKTQLCEFNKQGRRLDAIRYLRQHSDAARWEELGLSEEYYLLWVGLASNMQGLAVDYEPTGNVNSMDIFVADPLSHVAKDRKDWIETRLSAWKDFVRTEVRFHDVQGAHYTMLNPGYVANFAETLRRVLRERGL
jgi:acyl-CoA synthetase (AMP-forming)/AMP-acid ligase II/thioesterase domain-containing protein